MRWRDIVGEAASSGGTTSGSVAVATNSGAIGSGFDPDAHKGIYDELERKTRRHKPS